MLREVLEIVRGIGQKLPGPVLRRTILERELTGEWGAVMSGNRTHLKRGGARGDEFDRGIYLPHGLGEHVVLNDIVIDGHVAQLPLAVHLIANAPPLDLVGFGMAVGRAHPAHGRLRRAVGIFDPLGC